MQLKTVSFSTVQIQDILFHLQNNSVLQSGATLLDSNDFDEQNNTAYLCIKPKHVYEIRGDAVYIDGVYIGKGKALLYEQMRLLLAQYACDEKTVDFIGGFVGYVSYEATPLFLNQPVQSEQNAPSICFRFYTQVMKIQHNTATVFLLEGELFSEWEYLIQASDHFIQENKLFSDQMQDEQAYTHSLRECDFVAGVKATKTEIERGNVYQLNLTRRLQRKIKDKTNFLIPYYMKIRTRNKAPYSMLWLDEVEHIQFASSSPEQFFKLQSGRVWTKPIKGTRPRKNDIKKDNQMRNELRESEKDHAELLMITDLLRNDLNRVVENGTVVVEEFAAVCDNPTVFHLVSTITADLPEKKDALDLLDGLFPGGSITGAPKKAAVECIDQLEMCGRGLYTGCSGYISVNGDADFNILIRTLFQKHDTIDVHVGGGIVYESIPHLEYLETKQKAKAILTIIEEVNE